MKNHRWVWPLLAVLAVALTVLSADSGVANSRPLPDVCRASALAPQSCQGIDAPTASCAKQTCAPAPKACKDASTAKCAKAHCCAAVSKCAEASACVCGAKCKHAHAAACGVKCEQACAATCKAKCKESCAGACGTKCKLSCAEVCGPRCRSAYWGKAHCECGKVSCRLYGIGCGKARHVRATHRCTQPCCQKPCSASPGKARCSARASTCAPGCQKPCCNPPQRKAKRLRVSKCEPGCQKPCCASPGKVAKRIWVEKSGSGCEKARGQKAKKVSLRLEGPAGGGVCVIKANPGDEHVWVEGAEAGCGNAREREVKKIRIKHSGDAEVKEIYIDDDGVWDVDPDDEEVYILKSDEGEIPYLGVYMQDLTTELREAFDLPHGVEGALITDVERSSPAKKSGVRKGFVVVEFDGTPIRSADDLVKAVRASEPGDRVTVVMNRRGSTITRRVTLGSRPAEVKVLRDLDIELPEFDIEMPQIDIEMPELDELVKIKRLAAGAFLGVSAEALTEQQRAKLDLPEDVGVVVNEVHEGTAADKVGLQEGDIILKIDSEEIEDTEDLVEAISSREPGDEVTLVLLRDGKKKKVDVELGGREPSASIKRVGPRAMIIKPGKRLEVRRDALKKHMIKLQQRIQELEEQLDDLEDELEELQEEED